jgi:hypothetical protein
MPSKAMPAKPKEEVSYMAEPVPAFPGEEEMNLVERTKSAVAAEPAQITKPAVAAAPVGTKAGPKAAESASASEPEFEEVELEDELEEVTVEEEPSPRRPPVPPKPKRLLPPPEPVGPPPPKSPRAKAAEANLHITVSNPKATRTAKRKARREYREATVLEPPKGPY